MKKIGFWTALALVVGNILGVGIFTTTGYLADKISDPNLILLAWLVGAVYALTGAQAYGILAASMPYSGGDYIYYKKHYHPYISYLFGWSGLFITYTGSIAALAIGGVYYLNDILPGVNLTYELFSAEIVGFSFAVSGIQVVAAILILIFSYINHRGLHTAGSAQILLTTLIVVFMLSYIIIGYFSGADHLLTSGQTIKSGSPDNFLGALAGVLFTYMGWTTVVYIAAEFKDPKKNIPRALITGVVFVAVLYIGMNFIFLSAVPVSSIANEINVASLSARKLWGTGITRIVAVMIFIAILSSLNSTILSGPHIYKVMAKDGYLWKKVASTHPGYGTPYVSIWIQAIWSVVLLLSGTFNQLLTIVVAAILMFSIFSGSVALKILFISKERFKYSIWKWSAVIIYLLLCLSILFQIMATQFIESLLGFLILMLSLPFYLINRRRNTKGLSPS